MNYISLIILFLPLGCQQLATDKEPWLTEFDKPAQNPIMVADSTFSFIDPITDSVSYWQKADVFNPAAIVKDDTVFMLFRAEDNPAAILGGRTSRIGLAWSLDGLHFTKYPEPVLYPDSMGMMQYDYPGGCEDPRVVATEDGRYIMAYTSWNRDVARLSIASSPDLRSWTKHGSAFALAHQGKYVNDWSKSGSIDVEQQGDALIAKKINGKYWMYWGELFVNVAWSDDLINWIPLLDTDGELMHAMDTRPGYFDSFLTEPGPPALYTDRGILLFYNGKNDEGELAAKDIAKGTYCGGQALFDPTDPARLITRMDQPFICPDLPHEMTGQYKAGTTFIEGLVYFKSKWWLYYGTADSMVGVATSGD